MTGTKFEKNIKRLKRENQLKVEAARPLAEFKQEFGEEATDDAITALEEAVGNTEAALEEAAIEL